MISTNNYFNASRGVFKTLPRKVLNTVLTMKPTIKLNGRTWFLNHVSMVRPHQNRDAPLAHSVYYVSEDTLWLIRASNHWTTDHPCSRKHRAHVCSRIAQCHWSLDRSGQETKWKDNQLWQAGIIKFSDLVEN